MDVIWRVNTNGKELELEARVVEEDTGINRYSREVLHVEFVHVHQSVRQARDGCMDFIEKYDVIQKQADELNAETK